jgi:hypothetical protein
MGLRVTEFLLGCTGTARLPSASVARGCLSVELARSRLTWDSHSFQSPMGLSEFSSSRSLSTSDMSTSLFDRELRLASDFLIMLDLWISCSCTLSDALNFRLRKNSFRVRYGSLLRASWYWRRFMRPITKKMATVTRTSAPPTIAMISHGELSVEPDAARSGAPVLISSREVIGAGAIVAMKLTVGLFCSFPCFLD